MKIQSVYFGTTIQGEKTLLIFSKRYAQDNMFMRGNGILELNDNELKFSYLKMKKFFTIPIHLIQNIETGKSHAGQNIFQNKVLKIYWNKKDKALVSGFKISEKIDELKRKIEKHL